MKEKDIRPRKIFDKFLHLTALDIKKYFSKLSHNEVFLIDKFTCSFFYKSEIKKKLTVVQKFLENVKKEDLPTKRKVFTCFELIEHLHNPSKFIKNLAKLMSTKDLFIFTTLSSSGADILALWDNSKAIIPPHHINFFNPKSIVIFLKKNKFKILSISTPGKLDIDILENEKKRIKDRFWKTFIYLADKTDKVKMQNLITSINFSSHMMLVCQK